MFNKLDRKYLIENPFMLIRGEFYKFKEICFVEAGNEIALFVAVNGNDKELVSVEKLNESMGSNGLLISAIGKAYELLLETKRTIEIGQMK
jgi:hypothetical protein